MNLRKQVLGWVAAAAVVLSLGTAPAKAGPAVIGVGFPARFTLTNGAVAVGTLTFLNDGTGLGCMVCRRPYTYPPWMVVSVETATGVYVRSGGTFVYLPR